MIGEIIEAVCLELKDLFKDESATVLRDVQFKEGEISLYDLPLVLVKMDDSPDSNQFLGGGTLCDWSFKISVYFYDTNSGLDDDNGYTTSAYAIIDTIRRHIALKKWRTTKMTAVSTDYNFKMTLNGIPKFDQVQTENGGIMMGYTITYDTFAYDEDTNFVQTTTYATMRFQGIEYLDDTLLQKVIWLPNVLNVKTAAQYTALTGQVIGNRYYISDTKKIKEVLTINGSGVPQTSTETTLILNNCFFNDAKAGTMYFFDGTNINEVVRNVIYKEV